MLLNLNLDPDPDQDFYDKEKFIFIKHRRKCLLNLLQTTFQLQEKPGKTKNFLNMKFLPFFPFWGQLWPTWRIRMIPIPDPLTHLAPDPEHCKNPLDLFTEDLLYLLVPPCFFSLVTVCSVEHPPPRPSLFNPPPPTRPSFRSVDED
jgi:hypothetical protein